MANYQSDNRLVKLHQLIFSIQRAGRKKSSRSLSNHKDGGILQYGSDFNIQNSWVSSGKIDMLRESMLSYSKRMSDIRRIRGIQTLKQVPTPSLSTNSLWINMSKGSVEVNTLEHTEALMRKSFPPNMPGKVSRSLGTIKLEPLLGSQKAHNSMEIEKTSSLHTQKFEKERGYHTEQLKRSSQVGIIILCYNIWNESCHGVGIACPTTLHPIQF